VTTVDGRQPPSFKPSAALAPSGMSALTGESGFDAGRSAMETREQQLEAALRALLDALAMETTEDEGSES